MSDLSLGVFAILTSGILNGAFTFPMKLVKKWRWENIWLLFGLFGLVLFPLGFALALVPHLGGAYRDAPPGAVASAALLGLAWGVGSLLFGLAVSALGMSLGYSIIMGTTTVFGALVPAIVLHAGMLATARGGRLLGGLAAVVFGLILCAIAGRRREAAQNLSGGSGHQILTRTGFRRGLLMSVLSGVLSACFNIGFAFTAGISQAAERKGASGPDATFAIWAVIMGAGFIPSLLYCMLGFRRNASFGLFRLAPVNWLWAVVMGALWIFGVKLYGDGAVRIGALGATIGWPVLMSSTIITANAIGYASGEWNNTSTRIRLYLFAGLAALVAAVILAGSAGLQS
jgi:L-rhamnose-H+ transport protein